MKLTYRHEMGVTVWSKRIDHICHDQPRPKVDLDWDQISDRPFEVIKYTIRCTLGCQKIVCASSSIDMAFSPRLTTSMPNVIAILCVLVPHAFESWWPPSNRVKNQACASLGENAVSIDKLSHRSVFFGGEGHPKRIDETKTVVLTSFLPQQSKKLYAKIVLQKKRSIFHLITTGT